MLIAEKYKILTIKTRGRFLLYPVIKNSYLYTLWVLSHVHSDITLCEVNKATFREVKEGRPLYGDTSPTDSRITYKIPSKNTLLRIKILDILTYLGPDECILLFGEGSMEEITRYIREDPSLNKEVFRHIGFYDYYMVSVQVNTLKVPRTSPKHKGMRIYKYTSKSRKTFNRHAEKVRKLLEVNAPITTTNKNKSNSTNITSAERDYYESQIHDFVVEYIMKGKINGKH